MTVPRPSLIALLGAFTLVVIQIVGVRRSIEKQHEIDKPPITYGEWIPDADSYHPGDTVHFNYTLTVPEESLKPIEKQPPVGILILIIDAFENVDTGELSPGNVAPRVVAPGVHHLQARRRLPLDCAPGTHILEGWARVEGRIVSQPCPYISRTFTVSPK